ncbi:MAG: hypothetical protein QNJ92_12690 [Alphaproteobacteria bacterium]|nr:hypothetical protein [Alphaproteobacteria bacterium]
MGATVVQTDAAMASRPTAGSPSVLQEWLRAQKVNMHRAALAFSPFAREAFGTGAAAPSPAQMDAANALIVMLRKRLIRIAERLDASSRAAGPNLRRQLELKSRAGRAVGAVERVWDFYYELFNQRQAFFADRLLVADRIALDCYQAVYVNLGRARSVPTPRPFTYIDTGFGPATFRRGVRLSAIGRRSNPFPLITLPPSRLAAPWTLGAIPHEVGHNLQSDLGLWVKIRSQIQHELSRAGHHPLVVKTFGQWHKETFADLIGVLLIGPTYVRSLMDVVGRDVARSTAFNPLGVHPTPVLRVPLNLALVRRMGFEREASDVATAWQQMYPPAVQQNIPPPLRREFATAATRVVDTIIFQPYPELGGVPLAKVIRFDAETAKLIDQAATRLAKGTNPGILPERFLIAAIRRAFDRRLAPPGQLARNFYDALARR